MGSYKQSANLDATEIMEKLSDIRYTVQEERKKRLAKSTTSGMLSTFHSGQENAASKKAKSTNPTGFGKKKW